MQANPAPFAMDAGAVRVSLRSDGSYDYEGEYRLTGRGGVLDILASGRILARTCDVLDVRLIF